MTASPLRIAVDGPVANVTLARPERLNALSPQLMQALIDAATRLTAESALRVVLLHGDGRAFSAGFDLTTIDLAAPPDLAAADLGRRMVLAWESIPALTLASVHGSCVGGGVVLALACDLRIASANARFSLPELDIGMPLSWGGVPRLVRAVGATRAMELIVDTQPIDAGTALAWGLVNRVVADDRHEADAQAWAQRLARHPQRLLQVTKRRVAGASLAHDADDAAQLLAALADPQCRSVLQRAIAAWRT